MKKTDMNTIVTPVQPYILLKTANYRSIKDSEDGFSHFYEFFVQDGKNCDINAVPDGSIDLLFNIGENKVHTYISGTVFGAKPWQLGEENNCFGVRFQPGCGILPKELSMSMLVNEDLEIDGNIFGENLVERIVEAKDLQERRQIFKKSYEGLLLKNETNTFAKNIAEYVRKKISETKGQVTVNELSEETGYSLCYLRRVFKEYYGISPKQFSQFIRFQNLLKEVSANGSHPEDLALICGYYDEAHMMKEFKRYAGITLGNYIALTQNKNISVYC